jgi:hypothetical protein
MCVEHFLDEAKYRPTCVLPLSNFDVNRNKTYQKILGSIYKFRVVFNSVIHSKARVRAIAPKTMPVSLPIQNTYHPPLGINVIKLGIEGRFYEFLLLSSNNDRVSVTFEKIQLLALNEE